jgi:hypothetical protein
MFATPAILSLLFFVYVRPQELVPGLERVPLLYLLVGVALVALALDVRLGYVRLKNNPLLPWTLAHMAWCLLSMAVFARWALITQGIALSVAFILFTVLSQGAQTFRALATVGVGMLSLSLFVALVGFHQGFAAWGKLVTFSIVGEGTIGNDAIGEEIGCGLLVLAKRAVGHREGQCRGDSICIAGKVGVGDAQIA